MNDLKVFNNNAISAHVDKEDKRDAPDSGRP